MYNIIELQRGEVIYRIEEINGRDGHAYEYIISSNRKPHRIVSSSSLFRLMKRLQMLDFQFKEEL